MKETDVYYPQNSISYTLMMIFLIVNTYVSLMTLNYMKVSYVIGVYILLTITISLFSFLVAVRLRGYKQSGLMMCLSLLVVQVLRCIFMPDISKHSLLMLVLMIVTVGLLAASLLIAYKKMREKEQYVASVVAQYQR